MRYFNHDSFIRTVAVIIASPFFVVGFCAHMVFMGFAAGWQFLYKITE